MGAMKNLAIELEGNMQYAADLGYADLAYRLGLLEACRLIGDLRKRYIGERSDEDPFSVLTEAWDEIFDAAEYLADVAKREN